VVFNGVGKERELTHEVRRRVRRARV
jgi:hypothetical protein